METKRKTYEDFYNEFSAESISFSNNNIQDHKYTNDCEDACAKLTIDEEKDADAIFEALKLTKEIGF
jgi:hypothetical protein